ncbi:MAG: type II toxin-antitoxin system RelE/ParE family toxin [Bacteroidetes bacterium]|nr:MAG: type II toxin-antitoxin system RelE/ParE family toxin [Bacteroidota bacterium]
MKIEISRKFYKDLKKINQVTQNELVEVIDKIEQENNISSLDIKKMIGYENYFRVRIGKYRLGIKITNECVYILRVAKRDEIYKIFP